VLRVLVCTATRAEHDACGRGIRASSRPDHELLLSGAGPARASRSLADRLARGLLPDLVVSSGFAGALSPSLAMSSWITGIRISEWNGFARVPVEGVAIVEGPSDLVRCDVLSSTALLSPSSLTPAHPGSTPLVVDMESAALAREAGRKGVAFAVVRVISDTPSHPLPSFLSPFASALSATTATSRLAFATRALGKAIADPRGVARLVTDSATWLQALEEGWRTLASRIRT
jgi:nucleoside phosphorylase